MRWHTDRTGRRAAHAQRRGAALLWAAVATLAAGPAQSADDGWHSPGFRERAADVFVGQARQSPLHRDAQPMTREQARAMVDAGERIIDGWGVDGALARTPNFSHVRHGIGQPLLAAIWQYHLCNFSLALQMDDPRFAEDRNAQVTSILGTGLVTMVVGYLTFEYVAQGGDARTIEPLLTGERSAGQVLAAMQTQADVRASVDEGCAPVVVELVTGAIDKVNEGTDS